VSRTGDTRVPRADTGERWRALGFYHEPDPAARVWRFAGARSGLDTLVRMLASQADRAEQERAAVPLTIGPYDDFRIRAWERPGIDDESIYGPPADLRRLSRLLAAKLATASPGTEFTIGPDYVADVEFSLVFEVREERFDPAAAAPAPVEETDVVERDEAPPEMRSPALAFAFNDPDGSFTESEGVIWLEGDEIVIEHQTKDAFFGTFKSKVKVARVPLDAISWIRFKRGMFSAELTIQARAMQAVEHIPTNKQGRLRLKFTRDLRDEAAQLAEVLQAAIARGD
jgi:hypothetical protein